MCPLETSSNKKQDVGRIVVVVYSLVAELVGNCMRQGDPVVFVDAAWLVRTAHTAHVGDAEGAATDRTYDLLGKLVNGHSQPVSSTEKLMVLFLLCVYEDKIINLHLLVGLISS